jgi:hypothetical protein
VASTKVFDIPGSGKNSIDCARETSLFDVLVYTSEDKSFNESQWLDHEEEMNKVTRKR